ncbi:DUF1127 domain-containing protein [Defluviimonas sp. WL0075]|uniref:DUF1127 domain-containing protein n=1 Tax=Albidovulum sediminicola TaxID=2984331 RepID=A0ABT2YWX3_9RHOB|nr:DUF1127 domain-containing protein [Defluviimonas sp. WL0075]MCV2863379.1 DUF1127 domain-containing protein [Defluviimonas sp. WL0075]
MERTAGIAATHRPFDLLRAAAAPFRTFGIFLVALAEAGPRMEAIRRLNATSDEDLAARGLTRAGEVQRIFRDRYYV